MDVTVDSVRRELRDAIFWTLFHGVAADIELRKNDKELCRQKAIGFIEFGVNSKLITPDEGNDWLDAVWTRKSCGDVLRKYQPITAELPPG